MDPTKYKYYRKFEDLEIGFNHVIVVVKCDIAKDNNFVLTAYQTFISYFLEWSQLEKLIHPLAEAWAQVKAELHTFLESIQN